MTPGAVLTGGRARVAHPRFTIVTSSYNQGHFLEETIQSVIDQRRDDVEHVIFDGGSTDGSVDLLRRYDGVLAHWTSARDAGQPSAWNAGWRRARGELCGFINSDDLLLPHGLDAIATLMERETAADWFVGGTKYFGEGSGDLIYPGVTQPTPSGVLFFESYAPQPGQFFRRSLIERVGGFDETLQFSFDLDFFVRCALAGAVSAATSEIVAAFRFHGASKTVSQRARHRAETDVVEARHWPEIARREGGRARALRTDYKGHLALEAARDALVAGDRQAGWRLLADAVRRYPGIMASRAFFGTIQRLAGLRPSR